MVNRYFLLFLLLVVLSILPFSALAVEEGWSCDYEYSRDGGCDPANNLYCINNVCTRYEQSRLSCSDTELGEDQDVFGTVSYRYRHTVTGEIVEGTQSDQCYLLGQGANQSCRGSDCYVEVITCNPNPTDENRPPFYVNQEQCDYCSDGACGFFRGNYCNYRDNADTQCDREGDIYCLGGICQAFNSDLLLCNDTESRVTNVVINGTITYRYRNPDNGSIVNGIVQDGCYLVGQGLVSSCSGSDCKVREMTCSNRTRENLEPYQENLYPCYQCNRGSCVQRQQPTQCFDNDLDGFSAGSGCRGTSLDCDDTNPNIRPDNLTQIVGGCGAGGCENVHIPEQCTDNKDNDCDGNIDQRDSECPNTPTSHCANGVRDSDESGVDCGGAYCTACPRSPPPVRPVNVTRLVNTTTTVNLCPAPCSSGEVKCDFTNDQAFVCSNHQWSISNTFSTYCSRATECVPGELVCDTENGIYRVCTSYGTLSEPLREGLQLLCTAETCRPGELICNSENQAHYICSPEGLDVTQPREQYSALCESNSCDQTQVQVQCKPFDSRQVRRCVNGQWTAYGTQGATELCSLTVPDLCNSAIAQFQCDNRQEKVRLCINNQWTEYDSQDYSVKCQPGEESSGLFGWLGLFFS
ncbi:TPA: hypothetical protein HA241_06590 [Candidatus Woesearchaeota archaeon]|nr:hypothetical protein [Candidatus Woesearchaeota archaeon]